MPKAVEGWHIGGLVGCWPGPGMALMSLAVFLCCLLATSRPRQRGLIGVVPGHPLPERGVPRLAGVATAERMLATIAWAPLRLLAASVALTVCW